MISEEGCKLPKPLVEKRRRARFNKSLEELKHLVPEMAHGAIRMDKADILELTVSHLKALQEECVNEMDTNADPSYKDGFKRCIDETANVILATPVPEEIKHHFITQLKLLSLGQDSYSPLTPEYERNEFSRCSAGFASSNHTYTVNPATLFPAVSPLSSSTSPHAKHSASPFDSHSERLSAFNSVESSRTSIKQEVHSPQKAVQQQQQPPAPPQPPSNSNKGIWRPW